MTGCAPDYLISQFIKKGDISKCNTRSSQKLNIPLFRTALGQRTFYYRSMTSWNDFKNNFKLCSSVDVFKRLLRRDLFMRFLNN